MIDSRLTNRKKNTNSKRSNPAMFTLPMCMYLETTKKMLWPFTTREYYYYTKPNQKKNTKNLSCITCFFSKFSKTVVVVINVVVVVVVNWSIDSMWLRVYMSIRKKNWWTWTKIYFVHVPVVVIFIIIINIIIITIINVVSLSWTVWSLFLMQ